MIENGGVARGNHGGVGRGKGSPPEQINSRPMSPFTMNLTTEQVRGLIKAFLAFARFFRNRTGEAAGFQLDAHFSILREITPKRAKGIDRMYTRVAEDESEENFKQSSVPTFQGKSFEKRSPAELELCCAESRRGGEEEGENEKKKKICTIGGLSPDDYPKSQRTA